MIFVQVLELMREILEDNCDYMGEGSDTSDENNHADNTPFKQRSTYLQRSGLFVVFFLFCGETLLKVSFVGRFIRILKRPFIKSFGGTVTCIGMIVFFLLLFCFINYSSFLTLYILFPRFLSLSL